MYFQQELFPYFTLFIQFYFNFEIKYHHLCHRAIQRHKSQNQFFSYLGILFALSSVKTKR